MAAPVTFLEQKHWPRWTTASFAKHFFDTKESSVEFYLEGTLKMDADSIATDLMELRIDGPHMRQTSAGVWVLEVNIGILMITKMPDNDLYKHQVNIGNIVDDMTVTMEIYKYGSGVDDDQSLAWCMNRTGEILIRHFGQPDTAKLLQQSSVEGDYLVTLQV
jgi:hypothetical protein